METCQNGQLDFQIPLEVGKLCACFARLAALSGGSPPFGGELIALPHTPLCRYMERYGLGLIVFRSRSLVLYGDTRLGKTVWSRSLGPHVYFCGLYSYAEAVKAPNADYAVFDDIQGGIKFFPAFKNWLGCQMEFQVKGLYRDPQLLRWGKPSIWVANTDPRYDMSHDDVKWMEGNCIFVEITSAIFHASTGYPEHGMTVE